MFRSLILTAGLIVGAAASATPVTIMDVIGSVTQKMMQVGPMARFNVGDTASYNLSVSSFKGTLVMSITSVDSKGVMINQDVDLMGKQNIQELINPQTGEVIEMTVNGQKQTPPDPKDLQITGSDIGSATVPAGTFQCQDIKFHMKSENTDGEQWIDMSDVPVGGMVKMTTTQQGMPVLAELTSFKKN